MLIKLNIKGVLDSVDYVSSILRSCTREGKSRAVKSTVLHHLTGETIKHYTRCKGEVSNEIALYATVVSSAKEGAACFLSIKSLVNGRPVVLCNSDSLLETKVAKSLTNMDSNLVGSCLVYLVYCKLVQMDVEAAANTEYFQKKAYALVTDLAPFFGKAQDKLDVFLKTYEPVDDAVFRVDMDLTRRWMYVTFVSKSPPVRKRNPLIVPLRPVYDYMHDAEFLESVHNDELEDPTEKDS